MKKIMYTRPDGGVSIVIPAPKEALERILGELTEERYRNHIWYGSIPYDAIEPRFIEDDAIPADREFRNAWADISTEAKVDIHHGEAKKIVLERLREERKARFIELGFPYALDESIEAYLVPADKRAILKKLRDSTEPLKALKVSGHSDSKVLEKIRELGILDVERK